MGEANRWQDAFSQALREQAILIAGLIKQVQRLEKQINEVPEDSPNRTEVIHGITGAKYVPLVYPGPDGIPRVKYPTGNEQQAEPAPVHEEPNDGNILA